MAKDGPVAGFECYFSSYDWVIVGFVCFLGDRDMFWAMTSTAYAATLRLSSAILFVVPVPVFSVPAHDIA